MCNDLYMYKKLDVINPFKYFNLNKSKFPSKYSVNKPFLKKLFSYLYFFFTFCTKYKVSKLILY